MFPRVTDRREVAAKYLAATALSRPRNLKVAKNGSFTS